MDMGALSHMANNSGVLSSITSKSSSTSVIVDNGKRIPTTGLGNALIPTLNRPLHLQNVIITPNIIKNLVFVRKFTSDNGVSGI